jgi:hypothetical protein
MKFYEAAVLDTDPESLPSHIEVAQNAIGQRVITLAVDEAERGAIVKTLNALAILKRERPSRSICHQCRDAHDLVSFMTGRTFLAKTGMSEMKVTLHARCVNTWAEANSSQTLVPLRRSRAAGQR